MTILGLSKYYTDKIHYLKWYDPLFSPLLDETVKLLEIGIYHGGSLLLWKDYFPNGQITGADLVLLENI